MFVLPVNSRPLNEYYHLDTAFPHKQLHTLSFSADYTFWLYLRMAVLSLHGIFIFSLLHMFLANPTILHSEVPKGIYSFVSHFFPEN